MAIRFSVLASGSTGNATVVQSHDATVLVDAGLSAKKLELLMAERGLKGTEIDAIFITHEHSDHIKGLGALARKYGLTIYANEQTWGALERHVGQLKPEQRRIFTTGEAIHIGSLRGTSYAISHDAAEPVGYVFETDGLKLSLATDLGYVSDKVRHMIEDSDVLVLESNHDVDMVRMGSYPWNTKQRILGDKGHLSNEAAGEALCYLMTDRTKRVYLAHLSQNHNLMDLARLTINDVLGSSGIFFTQAQCKLRDTYYDRPTPWDEVSKKSM